MNSERITPIDTRVSMHAALAEPTRLRIVDLLEAGDASPSELCDALSVPSNLLAHHVNVLEATGLVTRRRSEGDSRRVYLSLTPGILAGLLDRSVAAVRPRRVLFVCTANTARSHLAAALWRRASSVESASAGTHPGDQVNPMAVEAAARHGIRLPEVRPRLLGDHLLTGDLVITVCDRAHEEVGDLAWAHWSVPDPVARGTDGAFDDAYRHLAERVAALAPRVPGPDR